MKKSRHSILHTAIIGAGPYGLSLAAHLHAAGIAFRIFGTPMSFWANHMPAGMFLKSDGFASNLSAPTPFTLEDFCRETSLPYHPTDLPIPLADFVAYGQEFARRLVPTLEPTDVTALEPDDFARTSPGFTLTFQTGEILQAQNVVLATGIISFPHIPTHLRHLPPNLLSHSTSHPPFDSFANQHVTVLGRGASSLNAAVHLHEAGAQVTLISRHPKIHVPSEAPATPLDQLSRYHRLRHPVSPLGHSLRSWLSSKFPLVFHATPNPIKRIITYKHLGPSGGAGLRGRILNRFEILRNTTLLTAIPTPDNNAITLTLSTLTGNITETRTLTTTHILAGTGFRFDLSRLGFLSTTILQRIRLHKNGSPTLNRYFQSSIPGLYFIGPTAEASFGPLLRFVAGDTFTCTRLTRHLSRQSSRPSS